MIAVEGKSSRKARADDSLCGWAGLIYCSNMIARITLVRDQRSEVGSSTITWSMAGSVATTSKGLIRGQKDLVCTIFPRLVRRLDLFESFDIMVMVIRGNWKASASSST
jgi:hypothetical protein